MLEFKFLPASEDTIIFFLIRFLFAVILLILERFIDLVSFKTFGLEEILVIFSFLFILNIIIIYINILNIYLIKTYKLIDLLPVLALLVLLELIIFNFLKLFTL